MSKKIGMTLTSDDKIRKTVKFQFSPELQMEGELKSTSVLFTLFVENEQVGVLEASFEDFDTFCLELAEEHKKIMQIKNQ